jgi:hypothetical protein
MLKSFIHRKIAKLEQTFDYDAGYARDARRIDAGALQICNCSRGCPGIAKTCR